MRRVARSRLIINEFGDLVVDGDVLKGCGAEACTEDDIIEAQQWLHLLHRGG